MNPSDFLRACHKRLLPTSWLFIVRYTTSSPSFRRA